MAVSANRLELLQIADAVAREKSIPREVVLESMQDALQKAARSRYGQETEIRADINAKTGEIRFSRLMLVVDKVENDATQITIEEARKKNPAAQVGDWIAETLPQSAVLLRDGFSYVFTVNEQSKVALRKIGVGRRQGERIEVLEGLSPDAKVVASGGGFLADGDTVRVVEAVAAPAQAKR